MTSHINKHTAASHVMTQLSSLAHNCLFHRGINNPEAVILVSFLKPDTRGLAGVRLGSRVATSLL